MRYRSPFFGVLSAALISSGLLEKMAEHERTSPKPPPEQDPADAAEQLDRAARRRRERALKKQAKRKEPPR